MQKMMIEAAINELATKEQNLHVPYGPEEVAEDAIACAKAGAAIVHFHARDAQTGEQLWTSADTYKEAIRLIRKECDAIIYPTYPGRRSKEERIGHVLELGRDPDIRLELATLDVGATNNGRFDAGTGELIRDATYVNTHQEMMYFMKELTELGVTFNFGLRDIGHARHVGAYLKAGMVPGPLILEIFFSDSDPYGPYPDAKGLAMYMDMVPREKECHWFSVTFGGAGDGSIFRPLSMMAAATGGHIRTGLGDNPRLDGRAYTNVEQVKIAVEMAHMAGREVATTAEARAMMGMVA